MFIILKILIKYTKLMIFLNKLKLLKSISLKKKPKLVNMKLKHKDKILMYAHFFSKLIWWILQSRLDKILECWNIYVWFIGSKLISKLC